MPDVFVSPSENVSGVPEKPPETESQRRAIEGHTHSRLSSFSLYPEDVDFETKEQKEQIVLLLRRHPITNVRWILLTLLLLTGPTLLNLFGIFALLPTGFPLVLTLSWYLVTSAFAIESFLDWYFNVYFVTDRRVIDVDFYNLINKRVSDAEIEKIQDVTYSTGGVVRTMFNYGDVLIQTAAEVSEFEFEAVPNPEKVSKILDDLMGKK